MPPLNLLIKPASGSCNMRCGYCFYADEANKRDIASYGMMSLSTLENVVQKSLDFATRQCTIAFQGGEPTLRGLDFYESLIELVDKHNRKKLEINYAIQTNGLLIDREWARFLSKNHFLVGLSLDGVKDIHDLNRCDSAGKGTFSRVTRAAQLFDSNNVQYNILTVVTARLAKSIAKTYNYFIRNNFIYQQYIPCLDPLGEPRGAHEYSLTPQLYGGFLCTLFDLWYNDLKRNKAVSIRFFDNLVGILLGYPPESCGMMGMCGIQNVVEADGGVYPCDFYVLDKYCLGNLNHDGYEKINESRDRIKFIESSKHISGKCRNCKWHPLCRGGCRRDREPYEEGVPALNYYCDSFLQFYEYAYPRLEEIAKSVRLRQTDRF